MATLSSGENVRRFRSAMLNSLAADLLDHMRQFRETPFPTEALQNNVSLIGRLGQDPVLRYTQGGTPVVELSIATNNVWNDKDGNRQERTDWHKIVQYGSQAENHNKHLRVGSQVGVTGALRADTYQDKDGNNRKSVYVIANRVDYLSRPGDNTGSNTSTPPPVVEDGPSFNDDDIPF
jgi:single-strand DNA-binding protein